MLISAAQFIASWRPIWRTLRFRLAIWNVFVVFCIALFVLIGIHQGVRWALLREVDQILQEDLQEVLLALSPESPVAFDALKNEMDRKALGHRQHGWFVELFNARDELVWISQNAPQGSIGPGKPNYLGPYSQDGLRLLERRVREPISGVAFIRVGASLDSLNQNMDRLDRLVAIACAALLIVVPLSGYWLAGRAARTVGEIIDTASRLRPSHLEERLPLRGTGDELDQLARTINHLLDRIAAYLDQRRDFLANAAHELRTPLAAIRSSVEVALSRDEMSDEDETILTDVIDQSASLETLVNQLLLISETETDQWKHHQERVPLAEVITRAVDMFQGVAESKEIEIHVGPLSHCEIVGSRPHLRQVVNNLIDNAVKYTPPGGRIEISLHCEPPTPEATLMIRDNGIGIAQEEVPLIFDRFFRADRSRNRDAPPHGSGLGLSICRAVVTAHGGTIHCESEPNTGTTMIVTLPLADSESVAMGASS